MKVTSRIQVNSYIFTTSKDILPILRTVNPVILKKSITSKNNEKILLKKFYELYKEKVTDILPGSSNSTNFFDPFFLILPNLQLFLHFYLSENKELNSTFIVEKNLEFVKFCPAVSFWSTQNDKIEETAISFIENEEIFQLAPIVVIDSYTQIDVYMDDNKININNNLSNEIKKKVKLRFPVPTVSRKMRDALFLNLKELNNRFDESVRMNFDSIFKNQ